VTGACEVEKMKIYDVFYHDETDVPYRYTERGLHSLFILEKKWRRAILPYPEYIRSLEIEDLPAHIVKLAKLEGIDMSLQEAEELAMQPMSDD
jgi:hypothetical protein